MLWPVMQTFIRTQAWTHTHTHTLTNIYIKILVFSETESAGPRISGKGAGNTRLKSTDLGDSGLFPQWLFGPESESIDPESALPGQIKKNQKKKA